MFSYWAYILIGQNNTGKTTFQRFLVEEFCAKQYRKLPRNFHGTITHPRAPRRLDSFFAMNRSFQEMRSQFKTVASFFARGFKEADICFLSSHADMASIPDIQQMIEQLHQRGYNVAAVFFSNSFDNAASQISCFPWQERFWINNPERTDADRIQGQLQVAARDFTQLLLNRIAVQ